MEDQTEVEEQLRQSTWQLRISHDHLLKVVEGMPTFVRERAQETADHLMAFHTQLRGLSAKLPASGDALASVTDYLAELRPSIERALRDLDLFLKELHEMLGEPAAGEASTLVN